jgi:phage baseplate assembly protein W
MADVLGTDLLVTPFFEAQDSSLLDLSTALQPARGILAGGASEAWDLSVVAGRQNIAQAMILRLLTPVGALADLGHASYGSRLSELIGQGKTDNTRNLARIYILEAVAAEPRVKSTADSLQFHPDQETANEFRFTLVVQPVSGDAPVALTTSVGV